MPTRKQLAANRANAQLSTGPATETGKNRSRQNALRHGLTGRMVVLPSEDNAAYLRFSKEIVDDLNPETSVELRLAQTIADSHWRLNRILAVESGLFAMGGSPESEPVPGAPVQQPTLMDEALNSARAFRDNTKAFLTLSIYEQRLQRAINLALKQLQELQAERKKNAPHALTEAIRLHRFHEMKDMPWTPKDDGFVYSQKEIETEHLRRQRRRHAQIAEEGRFDLHQYESRVA